MEHAKIPMLSSDEDSNGICMKIVSGNNSGASVHLLEGGEYSVGSGDYSDIVITDDKIRSSHFILSVNDKIVSITATGGDVTLSGVTLSDNESQICTSDNAIMLGDTCLLIGPSDQIIVPFTKLEASNDTELQGNKFRNKGSKRKKVSSKNILGTTILCLFILLTVLVFTHSPAVAEQPDNEFIAEVKLALNPLVFNKMELYIEPDGQIVLGGYTKNNNSLLSVMDAVSSFGNRLKVDVISDERLMSRVTDVLSRFSSSNEVKATGSVSGHIEVAGLVPDIKSWKRVISTIKRDISDIQAIDDSEVVTIVDIRSKIERRIVRDLQLNQLVYSISDNEISIEGQVDLKTQGKVANLVNDVTEQYKEFLSVTIKLKDIAFKNIDIHISSVSYGVPPYFISEAGEKYLVGARLSAGHVVKEIKMGEILFTKGENTITYQLD